MRIIILCISMLYFFGDRNAILLPAPCSIQLHKDLIYHVVTYLYLYLYYILLLWRWTSYTKYNENSLIGVAETLHIPFVTMKIRTE